jgi:hypothetical protein
LLRNILQLCHFQTLRFKLENLHGVLLLAQLLCCRQHMARAAFQG